VESGYVAGQNDPAWVLARGERRAMTYGAYRAVFSRINRRLGTNWTPHDLRHTACVRILDAGMALHEVQEIMGHRHLTAFITNTRGGPVGRGSSWPRAAAAGRAPIGRGVRPPVESSVRGSS